MEWITKYLVCDHNLITQQVLPIAYFLIAPFDNALVSPINYILRLGKTIATYSWHLSLLSRLMIHQIFLLACDCSKGTSKRSTLPNTPRLKPGYLREYHPNDIPQLSNLTFTVISLRFTFDSRWERVLWLLPTEREFFFCSLSCTRKHSKENIPRCIQ